MRKDLASSVLPGDLSLLECGLEGGLGGLSALMDSSSAEEAKTLVLEDAALILPFPSWKGEADNRLDLSSGFDCLSRSSSSDDSEELQSVADLEVNLETCPLLQVTKGVVKWSLFLSLLLMLLLRLVDFWVELDFLPDLLLDLCELEELLEEVLPCWLVCPDSEVTSDCESCELTDTLLWGFLSFLSQICDLDGSPFSMFNADFRKSLLTYLMVAVAPVGDITMVEPPLPTISDLGTGGFRSRASGDEAWRELTDDPAEMFGDLPPLLLLDVVAVAELVVEVVVVVPADFIFVAGAAAAAEDAAVAAEPDLLLLLLLLLLPLTDLLPMQPVGALTDNEVSADVVWRDFKEPLLDTPPGLLWLLRLDDEEEEEELTSDDLLKDSLRDEEEPWSWPSTILGDSPRLTESDFLRSSLRFRLRWDSTFAAAKLSLLRKLASFEVDDEEFEQELLDRRSPVCDELEELDLVLSFGFE